MSAYVLDAEAQRDLEAYVARAAADDVMDALRQEDRVALALDALAERPRGGRERAVEGRRELVRSAALPDTPLVAFYVEVPGGIRVLRVFERARED